MPLTEVCNRLVKTVKRVDCGFPRIWRIQFAGEDPPSQPAGRQREFKHSGFHARARTRSKSRLGPSIWSGKPLRRCFCDLGLRTAAMSRWDCNYAGDGDGMQC